MSHAPINLVVGSSFPESRVGSHLRRSMGFRIITQAVSLLLGFVSPVTVRAQSPLIELQVPGYPQAFKVEPDIIGVRVKSRVKTLDVQSAEREQGWTKCALELGVDLKPSLKYKEKLTDDERFATFDVTVSGREPRLDELLALAAMVDCAVDNVTAAGLVVRSFEDGRPFLLTGVAWGDRSAGLGSPWEKVWPDPFAPGSGRYLLKLKTGTDPLSAMSAESVEPILLPTVPSDAEAGFDIWLADQKSKEDSFSSKFSINSVGDESATTRQTKLSLGFEGSKGDFPTRFRVNLAAQVEFGDDAVEEDVTKINTTYEYYFDPWLGIFGYVERLTDDFLSIDQRYESGIGARVRVTARSRVVGEFCEDDKSEYDVLVTRNARRMLDVYRSRIIGELIDSGRVKKETRDEYCRYKPGIERRNARFEAALGLSFLGDYEQPSALQITATPKVEQGAEASEPITGTFTPPSSQKNRLNLSPSLRYRPNDRVSIFTEYSYKPVVDSPRTVFITSADGRTEEVRDAREDWYAEIVIGLTKKGGDGLDVELKLSWEEFHDAVPPRATPSQALEALGLGELTPREFAALYDPIEGLRANSTHTQFKVGLTIKP